MIYHSHKNALFAWHAVLIVLMLCSAVTYVWQINHQAEKSFLIKSLEERVVGLKGSIRDKELKVSSERSLAVIARRAQDLSLENPKDITFIKVGLSTVAQAEDDIGVSP